MAEQQTKKQVVHHRVALMDANGMTGAPDGPMQPFPKDYFDTIRIIAPAPPVKVQVPPPPLPPPTQPAEEEDPPPSSPPPPPPPPAARRVGFGMGKGAARRQQQGKTGSDVMPKKRRKPNGEGKILSVFG